MIAKPVCRQASAGFLLGDTNTVLQRDRSWRQRPSTLYSTLYSCDLMLQLNLQNAEIDEDHAKFKATQQSVMGYGDTA